MRTISEIALDAGQDIQDWSAEEKREAVIALFHKDEKDRYPGFMSDCLMSLTDGKGNRLAIMAAFLDGDRIALGAMVEAALLVALNGWQQEIDARWWEWKSEEDTCRREQQYDSMKEAM